MHYRITVRYGGRRQRYHTYDVEADDIRGALGAASTGMPDEVAAQADLVELRITVDPAERTYLEEPDA
jgi:hypothetical protein